MAMKKPPSESLEQQHLALWLDSRRVDGRKLLWAHVPNGGARSGRVGAALKKEGVKPGVPDVLVFTPPPNGSVVRGVAIELKRKTGGVASDDQKQWMADLRLNGWIASIAHGADEAIDFLTELGF